MKFINFKLGLVAIAVTASPLGTFATTAGNLAVVNLLPPPQLVLPALVLYSTIMESLLSVPA